MKVHRPAVALDARGQIATHGPQTPRRIVIHDTECGDAQGVSELRGVVNFWRQQGAGYGAHLIIDKDGNSCLGADFDKTTWHTLHRNTGSVGIELVGYAKFTLPFWFTRIKQLRECAKWIAYLSADWQIPIRFDVERGVSRHADQSKAFGGDHYDPGGGFPLGFVIRLANKYKRNGWT